MCMSSFLRGVAVGMLAGAVLEMVVCPYPKTRKTAVGKAMQRLGPAGEAARETVAEKMN